MKKKSLENNTNKETQRDYLTPEEIDLIENLSIPPEQKHLEKVRDMFLFSCYTGLRFSDVTAITADNFTTEKGKDFLMLNIEGVNRYANMLLYVLFNGKPSKLAKRYIQPDRKCIFDDFTNQEASQYLKVIAKLANINKPLHYYMSRSTFINLLVVKSVPIEQIQKILGAQVKKAKTYNLMK